MVLLVAGLSFLSANQDLHLSLHDDADHEDHSCFLTLLAAGHLEVACDGTPDIPRLERVLEIAERSVPFPPSLDLLLPPSCGPPAA
jgi:hypothetical protein